MILFLFLHIYFVSFTDKPEKSVPALSERAIEQRAQWNIPTDAMDYPVSSLYLSELRQKGVKIHHASRWFNGATCEMDEQTADEVKALSFVRSVEMTRDNSTPGMSPVKRRLPACENEALLVDNLARYQMEAFNLPPLHEAGFEGQGIVMAICDGGFSNAQTLFCFRQDALELGHFDFTDDPYDFYEDGNVGAHGTECLSTISGIQDNYYGAATQAQYYLMRSEEHDTESPKEMDNLVVALETADSLGVNVFSVSLGYYYFDNASWDLPKSALDGKTTRASRAATIAARKGMLVCVAAGNEGAKEWKTVSVPADADSILTVGAVSIFGEIASFSSRGPSADGRVKPDVCAVGYGTQLIHPSGSIFASNGTSFATPLLASLAACLWSALPNESAMQIRERILQSSDRYTNPDPDYGYGLPDAWKAYSNGQGLQVTGYGFEQERPRKILRGDQVLIIRHGHIYNLSGQLVE